MTLLSGNQIDDLIINLLAGLIFFIFEVGLIAYLLPRILDYRGRKKWGATLKQGIGQLMTRQAHLVVKFNGRAKQLSEATKPFDKQVATVWVNEALPPMFAQLAPEARALADRATEQLVLFTPALTPKLHRALASWVIALDGFAEALDDAAHDAFHKVLNPPKRKEVGAEVTAPVRQAFEALDAATAALLDEAGIEAAQGQGVNERKLLPHDNFDAGRWTWIGNALSTAMNSQRVELKG